MASVSATNVSNEEKLTAVTDTMDKLDIAGGKQPKEVGLIYHTSQKL